MFAGYVPSFLAGWEFPSLSAAAHLSAALQRRVLSFLLRRTLGHLVKGGQLDLAQIDAGIGSGKVEIRDLELDEEAINVSISALPVAVRSGRIGKIAIQLPWPNLWSGELSVSVTGLQLHCALQDAGSDSVNVDSSALNESIISNADEIMEKDEEGRQLRESISQSLTGDGLAAQDHKLTPNAQPSSVVSTIVDALLRRLSVSVSETCITLSDEEGGADFDLKIGSLSVVTLSESAEAGGSVRRGEAMASIDSSLPAEDCAVRVTTRIVRLSKIDLFARDTMPPRGRTSPTSSRSSKPSARSTPSNSPERYMTLSQAVPDLLQSELSEADTSTSASLYASATENSRVAVQLQSESSHLVSSLGEEITFELRSTSSIPAAADGTMVPHLRSHSLQVALSVQVNSLAVFVEASNVCALVHLLTNLQSKTASKSAPTRSASTPASDSTVVFKLKALHLLCAYEVSRIESRELQESKEAFWLSPASSHPRTGHVRLRIEDVEARTLFKTDSAEGPSASLRVRDLAVYEYHVPMRGGARRQGQLLPVLVFDTNLEHHRETPSFSRAATSIRSFIEVADWRELSSNEPFGASPYIDVGCDEAGWKLGSRRQGNTDVKRTESHAIHLCYNPAPQVQTARINAALDPIHVFADLSMVNRLLPLLHKVESAAYRCSLSASNRASVSEEDLAASSATVQERLLRAREPSLLPEDLDDDSDRGPAVRTSDPSVATGITLTCRIIRLDFRVPSTLNPFRQSEMTEDQRISLLSGTANRAGILTVELRALAVRRHLAASRRVRHSGSAPSNTSVDLSLTVDEVAAYLCPTSQVKVFSFATLGKLEQSVEWPDNTPLVPSISISIDASQTAKQSTSIQIPSVSINLAKTQLDTLIILADDCSKWSGASTAFHHELKQSSQRFADPFKVMSSRILGRKTPVPSSADSATSCATEVALPQSKTHLVISISEIVVDLAVQHAHDFSRTRALQIASSDLNLTLSRKSMQTATVMMLQVMSISATDITDEKVSLELLGRTDSLSLTQKASPMLTMAFQSRNDSNTPGSNINATLRGATIIISPDLTKLTEDLRAFAAAPEGTFDNVEPSDHTNLSLKLKDVSLLLRTAPPPTVSGTRAVVTLAKVGFRTKLFPNSQQSIWTFACEGFAVLVTDGSQTPDIPVSAIRQLPAAELWRLRKFTPVMDIQTTRGSLKTRPSVDPKIEVDITRFAARLTACADTMQVVTQFTKDFSAGLQAVRGSSVDLETSTVVSPLHTSITESSLPASRRDMLVSVDEDAFRDRQVDSMTSSIPDLIEDDVPANPAFLGERANGEVGASMIIETPLDGTEFFGSESVTSLAVTSRLQRDDNVVLETENVTVRLLDPAGLKPTSDFFSDPHLLPLKPVSSSLLSRTKVRLANVDISLSLFGGYDWATTRQAIENEARAVRRRLQKIKQLVASGQTPDDSVEQATRGLFESVHITLPTSQADANADAIMQALDDEIGGDDRSQSGVSEDSSTASSAWEPLQTGQRDRGTAARVSQRSGRRHQKLERSARALIDIQLRGLEAEYDSFGPESNLASRIAVDVRSLQIIDDVPTSTWRTFLTAMPPDGPAYQRSAVESKMVRVEVRELRSLSPTPGRQTSTRAGDGDGDGDEAHNDVEVRMRAKVAPLRLHVDQDALDFIKKFFAFRAPGTVVPAATSQGRALPFIQHAEIYPIRLKLDYKPKRVDYGVLRAGQTIELMNFFHFDGAEMTLRRVTLRGISGWSRLFETLNDVWTPDVKANQLADVLAGVAPIRTLVNVGAGVADLVLLPIEQYQKDGRIFRGIQKGANSFAKTTVVEAVKLGARLATGTQVFLERAEHVLGGRIDHPLQGAVVSSAHDVDGGGLFEEELRAAQVEAEDGNAGQQEIGRYSKFSQQPEDMREALSDAYRGLSQGLHSAAQTILAVPMEVYERGSGGDGAGGSHPVVRAVPIAVLRGAAGASEAISKTLMGVRNVLEPHAQSEVEDKYKRR